MRSFFDKITKEGNDYVIPCDQDENSEFNISETSIELSSLSKCGEISGTTILDKIIKIGKELHKENIVLQDASEIKYSPDCRYSLAKYKILLTGQSWYNKFGFVSINHVTDREHNEQQRILPLHEFIDSVNTKYKIHETQNIDTALQRMKMGELKKRYQEIIKTYSSLENYKEQRLQKLESEQFVNLTQFIEVYADLSIHPDMPVYIVIQIIDAYLKTLPVVVCDDKIRMLMQFIKGSSYYMLKYNHFLVLTL